MNTPSISITIVAESIEVKARADSLAQQLGLASAPQVPRNGIILFVSGRGLSLATTNDIDGRVYIDFSTGKNAHRRKFGGGVNQTLARAVGLNKNKDLHIIDATGGLARDAFVLASLGAKVKVLEQSPILSLLIDDALCSGRLDPDITQITQRMTVHNCNSVKALLEPQHFKVADVIYLDPMYPSRQKNAAVKKDMQLLHLLIGADHSADKLLNAALESARKRVVVKRPIKAPPLSTHRLAGDVCSKNTRYDIYTPMS